MTRQLTSTPHTWRAPAGTPGAATHAASDLFAVCNAISINAERRWHPMSCARVSVDAGPLSG